MNPHRNQSGFQGFPWTWISLNVFSGFSSAHINLLLICSFSVSLLKRVFPLGGIHTSVLKSVVFASLRPGRRNRVPGRRSAGLRQDFINAWCSDAAEADGQCFPQVLSWEKDFYITSSEDSFIRLSLQLQQRSKQRWSSPNEEQGCSSRPPSSLCIDLHLKSDDDRSCCASKNN